ncbi:efflux RND transporter periplasmic adaptor subunit [Kordia algicida OT-1]|uniref:Cation efflux system protein/acriflavin resistance protein B family n=1 Tax=Kordia algicida OT-1 TaxID=391587 RepID=A9DN81_9FLAO|nr:efflux RND transporter periplasmic adaptor subunit [Kordia algicida]EDP97132.1 cation efflux system protein/acriflavin resistance protein B family [Kordia algicida OT-1]
MKKINILILPIVFILASCGGGAEKDIDTLISEKNIEAITKKRDALKAEKQELDAKIKQLSKAIENINPTKKKTLITVFTAKDTIFNHYLEIQGNVDTKKNIVITPEMSGILKQVFVKEGQRVAKGQILARVDDNGLSQQLSQLQIQADLAKTTFERQKRLWDQKIGSEIQFLQTKSAYESQQKAVDQLKIQLGKTAIRAPFSGVVDDVITEQGSVVGAGQTPIIRIVNLRDMYIEAVIPEKYLTNVTEGKDVEVYFPVLGKTIDAKIRQAGDFIDPNNRTFKVEIAVPNKEGNIKPNLTAKLKINDYTNPKAILIPQSVISENAEGDQYVYVAKDIEGKSAKAKRVIITTGKPQGDFIEVTEGLKDGDAVIKEGARSVKDEQEIEIITN